MNFIDSLTLLFLTLSAVKSAHIPKETERGPHDVIPLMEVYNKSLCQPRELLVDILQEYPEEVEHIFIPSCVVLTRCAGCCIDEMRHVCGPCCDHCSERRKRLFVQDPATCRCSCKHTDEYCKDRQLELNERTCKCDQPRR